ncbi:unnamed protein product, partial [Owenia fusiformis]
GMGQGFNPNPVMGQGPVFHQGIQNQGMFGQGINPMGQWPGQDQGQGIGQNLGMGQGNVPVQNWVGGLLQPGPWRPDQLGMVTQGNTNFLMFTGNQLDTHISDSVRQKIIKNEYVDLKTLLVKTDSNQEFKYVTENEEGEERLVLKPIEAKAKIASISDWQAAFYVFMTVC